MSRPLKITATLCALGLGLLASAPASAQYWHGRARVGVYLGVPLYVPYYDPPPPAQPLGYDTAPLPPR
jgi:hypothetical protein